MPGTSDAWLMSQSSHRPSEPAYHINIVGFLELFNETRRGTDELQDKVWENYRGETLFVYFFSNLITISKSLGGFQHQVCYLIDFLKVVSLSD